MDLSLFSSALQDTVVGDPVTCPWPSSCSTPNHNSTSAVVVAPGHKGAPMGLPLSPCLCLFNRYAVLADDNLVHLANGPAPPPPPVATTGPHGSAASTPSVPSTIRPPCHSIGTHSKMTPEPVIRCLGVSLHLMRTSNLTKPLNWF